MRPVLPSLAGKICVLALNRIIMKLYFLVNLLAARAFAYNYISLSARNCCDVFFFVFRVKTKFPQGSYSRQPPLQTSTTKTRHHWMNVHCKSFTNCWIYHRFLNQAYFKTGHNPEKDGLPPWAMTLRGQPAPALSSM